MRETMGERIAVVLRYLRGGKSPKEIAYLLKLNKWTVLKMIDRFPIARQAYDQSKPLRYSHPLPVTNVAKFEVIDIIETPLPEAKAQ